MIKIGLVDNYLTNYHCDVFMRLLSEQLADQDVQVVAAWEWAPRGERDWCAEHKVKRCQSPDEVAKEADYIMVMSPNNNEYHRMLAEKVIPYGKPVYIDKFLSPYYKEAEAIVNFAKEHKVPLMSSSALAFAVELEALKPEITEAPMEMFCKGISSWSNYGVHSIAPVVQVMGSDFKRLINVGTPNDHIVVLDYGNNKKATIEVYTCENEWQFAPAWQLGIKVGNKYIGAPVKEFDAFYANLFKEVVKFFKTGEAGFSIDKSLALVKILEDAPKSLAAGGEWINY